MNGIIAYKLAHFSIAQHHRHMIACQVSFHTMVCSLFRANMGSDNRPRRNSGRSLRGGGEEPWQRTELTVGRRTKLHTAPTRGRAPAREPVLMSCSASRPEFCEGKRGEGSRTCAGWKRALKLNVHKLRVARTDDRAWGVRQMERPAIEGVACLAWCCLPRASMLDPTQLLKEWSAVFLFLLN